MSFDQGEFDFDAPGDEHGYRDWRRRLDEQRRAFEQRWGVVIGRPVRVVLADHAKPLTGVLQIAAPAKGAAAPLLVLRGLCFAPHQILSLTRIGPGLEEPE